MALAPGDPAPDFSLLDQQNRPISLASFRGRKLLVYFYPRANTPGCTQQACALRDVLPDIGTTAIVGISPDKPSAQLRFDEKHGLGFPLLSDPDHSVAMAYGAWGEKKLYGKVSMGIIRSAFLIDETGSVAHAWPKISPKDTPTKLLDALRS